MNQEQSYYDIANFPKLHEICKKWEIIRDEFYELNAPIMPIHRINKSPEEVLLEVHKHVVMEGNQYGWVLGWGGENEGNQDWTQYGLVLNDQKVPFTNGKMKQTIDLFKDVKGIIAVALLKLKPNAVLHTHRHADIREKNALQLHLPIDTVKERNYNYLNVQGEFRQYECGKPIVFDGALDHFALNESHKERTTLYIEFHKETHLSY